jgi:hypothetical protein
MSRADLVAEPGLYYILKVEAIVGNCALWWRAQGQGYTLDLRDAGKYSAEDAAKIQKGSHGDSVAIPCAEVEAIAALHVDRSRAKDLKRLEVSRG